MNLHQGIKIIIAPGMGHKTKNRLICLKKPYLVYTNMIYWSKNHRFGRKLTRDHFTVHSMCLDLYKYGNKL
jgi:hypothetical protein